MQTPERRPVPGVVFDTSMDTIDRVLGLAMLLAHAAKNEARLSSLSISHNNLKIASFSDMMVRFSGTSPAIGMHEKGPAATTLPPMLSAPLDKNTSEGKPVYNRVVQRLIDTADPVALIRNALSAQQDGNAVVVLAGSPVNLLGLLALPTSMALIQKKVRLLAIAAPFEDAPGFNKLLAEWPGPIVVSEESVGQALPFPGTVSKRISSGRLTILLSIPTRPPRQCRTMRRRARWPQCFTRFSRRKTISNFPSPAR
jgi:hypothetical protein